MQNGKKVAQRTQGLWCSSAVRKLLDCSNDTNWEAVGVSIDSRTLNPGDLFIALKGPNFDGGDFIQEAANRGAVAALISCATSSKKIPSGFPVIQVQDPLDALRKLARHARERFRGVIVALTGTVGKTSVKEGLRRALCAYGEESEIHATPGNLNGQVGLPLTLANLPPDVPYGIFELGINQPKEMDPLVQLLKPHHAMILNVSEGHIGNFASLTELVHTKAEIFNIADTKAPPSTGILWRDSPHYEALLRYGTDAGISHWITFGRHEKSTLRILQVESFSDMWSISLVVDKKFLFYKLPGVGLHWVMNSVAVLASIKALGLDLAPAMESLKTFVPLGGRGRICVLPSLTVLDGTYNAAPESMRSALESLRIFRGSGRKWAVLGEMGELGSHTLEIHQSLASDIKNSGVEGVILCGSQMEPLYAQLPKALRWGYVPTTEELIPLVLSTVKEGDILLLKGSNALKLTRVLEALKAYQPSE